MTKVLSIALTAFAGGVLLAILGAMYVCMKLRVSPWVLPKPWFFFAVYVVAAGTTLEIWLARRSHQQEILDDEQHTTDGCG